MMTSFKITEWIAWARSIGSAKTPAICRWMWQLPVFEGILETDYMAFSKTCQYKTLRNSAQYTQGNLTHCQWFANILSFTLTLVEIRSFVCVLLVWKFLFLHIHMTWAPELWWMFFSIISYRYVWDKVYCTSYCKQYRQIFIVGANTFLICLMFCKWYPIQSVVSQIISLC